MHIRLDLAQGRANGSTIGGQQWNVFKEENIDLFREKLKIVMWSRWPDEWCFYQVAAQSISKHSEAFRSILKLFKMEGNARAIVSMLPPMHFVADCCDLLQLRQRNARGQCACVVVIIESRLPAAKGYVVRQIRFGRIKFRRQPSIVFSTRADQTRH
jgi:hypothetical protein